MAQVLPDALRVEIGYGSTPLTALSSVFWTDVTSSVRMSEGVSFNRGRFGNDALARPGSLSFTLDNGAQAGAAGRFTSGGSKVELRLPVRIRARYPFVTNMVANPSFETNTANWSTNGAGTTVTRVTTDSFSGGASASVARNASAGSGIFSSIMSVVAGQSYTASVYLKSPSGSGTFSVGIGVEWTAGGVFVSSSGPSSVTLTAGAAWQRVSVTGTAPATADGCRITVYTQAAGTAGHTFLVDAVLLEETSTPSTWAENLVTNPSFETNTTGWSTNGVGTTLARTNTDNYDGSFSALVTRNASSSSGIFSGIMYVQPSTQYTASVYLKSPTGSGTFTVGLEIEWETSGGTFISKSGPTTVTLTAGAAWQRVTLTGTSPGTARQARVVIYTQAAGTAGHTFLVDGVVLEGGASASALSAFPSSSGRVDLWVGYVESVAAGWDGGYRPVVRVSASDRLARLEKRKLPSLIRGEQIADSAVALWPLTDDVGSTAAGQQAGGDASDLLVRSVGTAGTLDFGTAGLAPGPDGLSCAVMTPNGTFTQGKYLYTANVGSTYSGASAVTAELFFYVPDNTGGELIRFTDGVDYVSVGVGDFAGTNYLNKGGYVGGLLYAGIPTVPATVGEWHHVAMTQTISGTTVTVKVFLDGALGYTWTYTRSTIIRGSKLHVGLDAVGVLYYGRVSHIGLYGSALSDAVIADHALLRYTLTNYQAQTPSAIFNRICALAQLPATEYQVSGTTSATMSPVPVANAGLLQAAELVATAEDGTVYLNRSGVLTLAARTVRQNPTSSFTIPAKCVDRGTSFSTDMSYMVNDVTVKRPAGITTRYVNTTSTTAYDTHDSNLEAYLATDNQAQELASRLARVNATPAPRVSDIKVDLVTGAADLDESAILTADVGTYFQVTNLPTGSPAATLHLFVEGMQHEVTDSAWQVTMTTTPASEGFYRNVWKLGDASLSQLGSTTTLAF